MIDAQDTVSLVNSAIFSDTLGKGEGGDTNITTGSLTLIEGARISTAAAGQGRAGNIHIHAPESVSVSGSSPQGLLFPGAIILNTTSSGLFASTEEGATGLGGNIVVTTGNLRVFDGGVLSAATSSVSPGGSITVNSNTFDASSGGQLLTTTSGSGKAGDIRLNVRDRLTLSGANTGLLANTEPGSSGKGGSILIDPEIAIIRDGARIAVDSRGRGEGAIFNFKQVL